MRVHPEPPDVTPFPPVVGAGDPRARTPCHKEMQMRFGIFTMPEHPPWENWTLSYDRDIAEIVKAEELGYEEYWIGEHHSGDYENVPMPELMIAKASAVTHRIKLGPGTVNLPYHDPFMVAERMAFLDHLTHGRLIWGYGGGGLPTDWALFDMPPEETRPRMEEAIEIINLLNSSTEPVSFKGKFWEFEDRVIQVRPYQKDPEQAIAGLTGLNSYKIAGSQGFSALSVYFTSTKAPNNVDFPDLVQQGQALDEAAELAGRDPARARDNWRIVREVYVSGSREQAMEEIRDGAQRSYDYLLELGLGALMKDEPDMPDDELTLEWMVENTPWIIGSPSDCIEQIKSLEEETGGFGVFVLNSRDWVPTDLNYRSMEMFARQVMPAFR